MDFKEQVKSSVDIVRVIGEHVRLKKQGARWVGLCPFHNEKTPSFSVHADHQFFKCFGCDKKGDVFTFIQEIEGVSFFEALRLLAERNGIPIPKRDQYSDTGTKLRAGLVEIHEFAAESFRAALLSSSGATARAYLERRGVSRQAAEEFGLGLAEAGGAWLARRLQAKRYPPDLIEESKLVLRREDGSLYDRFRHRLMFPIHNEMGKIIAFGGRALADDEQPKYLNSAETPLYRKSSVLYNLHRAKSAIRKQNRAILVEGYMDVIGVYAAGVREVVASCGTSLTNDHVRAIHRHTDHIVVNFDPDTAGSNAAERSIQMLLEEGMRARILELNAGLDPDEYIREHGAGAYQQALDRAPEYFLWLADRARRRFDQRTSEGKLEMLRSLLPAVQRVSNRLERMTIANEIASYLGLAPDAVLEEFRKAAAGRRETAGMKQPAPPRVPPVERQLLLCLIKDPDSQSQLAGQLLEAPFVERLTMGRIFHTLAAIHAAHDVVTYQSLHDRLEVPDQELLSSIVLTDSMSGENYTVVLARACLDTIYASERQREISELRQRIKQAERAGEFEAIRPLAQELDRLQARRSGE
ncbi:MAG: DNA primase [Bryobacterales bacterium]|nr:DNA primase [Bryobacterales bacterium]